MTSESCENGSRGENNVSDVGKNRDRTDVAKMDVTEFKSTRDVFVIWIPRIDLVVTSRLTSHFQLLSTVLYTSHFVPVKTY
jgi:hypothetical protein